MGRRHVKKHLIVALFATMDMASGESKPGNLGDRHFRKMRQMQLTMSAMTSASTTRPAQSQLS